jgi:hypothetical protein
MWRRRPACDSNEDRRDACPTFLTGFHKTRHYQISKLEWFSQVASAKPEGRASLPASGYLIPFPSKSWTIVRSKLRSPRRGNPAIYKVGTALRAVRCFPGSDPLFSKCGISCEIGPNRVHGWPATVCHSAKVHQAAIRTVATKRIDRISAIDRARTRGCSWREFPRCAISGVADGGCSAN